MNSLLPGMRAHISWDARMPTILLSLPPMISVRQMILSGASSASKWKIAFALARDRS